LVVQHDEVVCLDDVAHESGAGQALAVGLHGVDAGANARIIVDELLSFILLVVSADIQEVAGKSRQV
jgi:hypothetical protein